MYECEIGQGLLGNSVARAVGGAVQNATLPGLRDSRTTTGAVAMDKNW